jgi:hypothetical protein
MKTMARVIGNDSDPSKDAPNAPLRVGRSASCSRQTTRTRRKGYGVST